MILPDHEIFRQRAGGAIGIDPFDPEQIQPASYDLLLGNQFRIYNTTITHTLDPKSPERRTMLLPLEPGESLNLRQHTFCLASTVEKIRIPSHLVARVEGKSSLARMGLFVHVTAGFIDPGFEGHITLELFNANHVGIWLYPGMPIAQIAFERLATPAERPYGQGATRSKYANQPPGPVESMYFRNFQEQ
jgi:dCTP deaminase